MRYLYKIMIIIYHPTQSYLPLFLPLYGQHALPAFLTSPTQAAFCIYPFETFGQYVTNVG